MWDLSSLNRDQTRIPCIGKWIFNHWTTRKVPRVEDIIYRSVKIHYLDRHFFIWLKSRNPHIRSITRKKFFFIVLLATAWNNSAKTPAMKKATLTMSRHLSPCHCALCLGIFHPPGSNCLSRASILCGKSEASLASFTGHTRCMNRYRLWGVENGCSKPFLFLGNYTPTSYMQTSGSLGVVPGLAALASLRHESEMQIPRLHPRPPESDIPLQGSEIHVLTDSLGNSAATTMGSPPPSLISGTPDQEWNTDPAFA